MRLTRDEALRIRLERDVVDVAQAPDRDPLARQVDLLRGGAFESGDDDLRRASHGRDSIDRPSPVHGSRSSSGAHSGHQTLTPMNGGDMKRKLVKALFGIVALLIFAGGAVALSHALDDPASPAAAAANTAAAEDGAVQPGEPAPNDNYVVEEGHRLLTFLVQRTARVTVLARTADGFASKAISVPELAQLVAGNKPVELFESLQSGIWLRVHIDTACSIEQQYRP